MTHDSSKASIDLARRDRVIWTTLVLLGVLVAGGVLALGWGVIQGRLTAAKQLDRATALLSGGDATIVSADEIIRAEVSPETAAKAAGIDARVQAARSPLAEADVLAGAGIARLTDDELKLARLIQQAAKMRIAVLDAAVVVLSATQRAATAEELAADAWTRTLAADELARGAVAEYNTASNAGVKKAVTANGRAKVGFAQARLLLRQADIVFPEAKLAAFVSYVEKRLALVALAKKADDAWLAGRIVQANELRASYNAANDSAVESAKLLPGSPVTAIDNAYKTLADTPSSEYYKARQRAAEADKGLTSR